LFQINNFMKFIPISDILKEMVTIASGKASSALAEMLDLRINVNVPTIRFVNIQELPKELSDFYEEEVVGIYFKFFGGMEGDILCFMAQDAAKNLLNLLLGEEMQKFDDSLDIIKAALKEVGNIVINSYINAMSNFLNLEKTVISVPFYSSDVLCSMLNTVLCQVGVISDEVIIMDTNFETKETEIGLKILTFLQQESVEKIYSIAEKFI